MLSSCSRGTTDLLIGGDRPCSGVWTRTRRSRKKQETEVWWKCFFRASPSHKPQQLSSTAPGMCRKGCSPDRCRGEKHSEVWVAAPTRASWLHKKESLIHKDARNQLNSFPPTNLTRPNLLLPLTTLPLEFHLHFGIYQNWVGQTVCQHATFILPGLWDRGQLSVPYSATQSPLSCYALH